MRVITAPTALEDRTFDALVQGLHSSGESRYLVDARRVRWVEPFGILGLLALGEVAGREGERPILQLPEASDVVGYLTRLGFFGFAEELFELHGAPRRQAGGRSPDVLLEITRIRSHGDIHSVVDRVHEQAIFLLTRQLGHSAAEAIQFSVILSEVCQNIIEHAQADGWVATQTYSRTPRLSRRQVKIAVVDLGIGFRKSLASAAAARYGDRWSDATALEAAFMHGLTRFHDPGRGQGLQQIRKRVGRWGGSISIRSGTARIADVPSWDDAPPLEEGLPEFPGAQISVVLPAREGAADPAGAHSGAAPMQKGRGR